MGHRDLIDAKIFYYEGTEDLKELKDKKVIDIGFVRKDNVGGLCIDYEDGEVIRRIIVDANDLGTWIEWHGIKGDYTEINLMEKINSFRDYIYSNNWKHFKKDFKVKKNKDGLIVEYKNKSLKLELKDIEIIPGLKEIFSSEKIENKDLLLIFCNFNDVGAIYGSNIFEGCDI